MRLVHGRNAGMQGERLSSATIGAHARGRSSEDQGYLTLWRNNMDTNVTTMPRVLPDLSAEQRRIAELEAQIARMKAANNRRLTLKVSAQGAVSLYGMGRWPVTLYKQQWEKVLDMAGV